MDVGQVYGSPNLAVNSPSNLTITTPGTQTIFTTPSGQPIPSQVPGNQSVQVVAEGKEYPATQKHGWATFFLVIAVTVIIVFIVIIVIGANKVLSFSIPAQVPTLCSLQTSELSPTPDLCTGSDLAFSSLFGGILVGPRPLPYATVCGQICVSGFDASTNTCPKAVSGSDEAVNFNDCISATKPDNCTGAAKPLYIRGKVPYYANSVATACPKS